MPNKKNTIKDSTDNLVKLPEVHKKTFMEVLTMHSLPETLANVLRAGKITTTQEAGRWLSINTENLIHEMKLSLEKQHITENLNRILILYKQQLLDWVMKMQRAAMQKWFAIQAFAMSKIQDFIEEAKVTVSLSEVTAETQSIVAKNVENDQKTKNRGVILNTVSALEKDLPGIFIENNGLALTQEDIDTLYLLSKRYIMRRVNQTQKSYKKQNISDKEVVQFLYNFIGEKPDASQEVVDRKTIIPQLYIHLWRKWPKQLAKVNKKQEVLKIRKTSVDYINDLPEITFDDIEKGQEYAWYRIDNHVMKIWNHPYILVYLGRLQWVEDAWVCVSIPYTDASNKAPWEQMTIEITRKDKHRNPHEIKKAYLLQGKLVQD